MSEKIDDLERLQNIKKLFFSLFLLFSFLPFIVIKFSLIKFIAFYVVVWILGILIMGEISDQRWVRIDKKIKYTDLLVKVFPNRYWPFWKK